MTRNAKRYPEIVSAAITSKTRELLEREALLQNISTSELVRGIIENSYIALREDPYYIYITEPEALLLAGRGYIIERAEKIV